MELTVVVRPNDRTVIFEEAHALIAGDVYSPLTVDFSDLEARPSDSESVQVSLAKSQGEAPFVAVTLSAVEGHQCLRSGSLSLRTQAMADWYADRKAEIAEAEETNSGSVAKVEVPTLTALGWLVVESSSTVYAACRVPVILRSFSVSGSGSGGGYYTTDAIDGMLSDVYSVIDSGVSSEASVRSAADSALSSRIDAVSVSVPSLSGYATESWVESKGYLTSHQSLEGYARTSDLSAFITEHQSLAGYATEAWVAGRGYLSSMPDTVATKTWVADMGYVTSSGLSGALSSYARKSDVPSVDGFLTSSAAADTYLGKSDAASLYIGRDDLDPDSVATTDWVESGFVSVGGLSDYLLSSTAASTYLTKASAASTYLSVSSAASYAKSDEVAASYVSKAEASAYVTSTEMASAVASEEASRMSADSGLSSEIDSVKARVSVLEASSPGSGSGSSAMRLVALQDGDSVTLTQSACNHVTASSSRSSISVTLPSAVSGFARGCSLSVVLPSGWTASSLVVTVQAGGATLVYDGSWRSGSAVSGAAAGSTALFVFNEVASGVVAVSSRVYAS